MIKRLFIRKKERGQAIVLVAFAIVGLIAIIGLLTDAGVLFIEYARLKRGIDAAAVSAALQFRQGYTEQQLIDAAYEFLRLNQSDVFDVQIKICDPNNPDPNDTFLCPPPPEPLRKLVRVTASRHVEFGFMRVIGFDNIDITASSVGEAASVDLVLVMDTSGSMAYETDGDPALSAGDDPAACNATSTCQPLESVKAVALDFLDTLYFPYDRVAVVALSSQTPGGSRNPVVWQHLTSDETAVRNAITNLKVFQPPDCDTITGSCLKRDGGGNFVSPFIDCPARQTPPYFDPSSCTSSNVGGAMYLAAVEFAGNESLGIIKREESVWIVIALIGGPANASDPVNEFDDHTGHNVFGNCPQSTWPDHPSNTENNPTCRDGSASTRHCINYPDTPSITRQCVDAGGNLDPVVDETNPYDADDYARDWADFVADPADGQGATVFTIGLGDLVINAPLGQPNGAEVLLQYMARQAGDENSGGAPVSHGDYYYAPDATALTAIFQTISENIFTRISQ